MTLMPDGSIIYYVSNNNSLMNLSVSVSDRMKTIFTKVLPDEGNSTSNYCETHSAIAMQVFLYASCILIILIIAIFISASCIECVHRRCCKKQYSEDVEMNENYV